MKPLWLLLIPCSGLLIGWTWSVSGSVHRTGDCNGCHIMNAHVLAWEHSPHGRHVTCTGCHLPHGNKPHQAFQKARDGGRHVALTLFSLEPDVLACRLASAQIVQANCRRCHPREGTQPPMPRDAYHGEGTRGCTDCHRHTGHPGSPKGTHPHV